jgi:hypothetical protein
MLFAHLKRILRLGRLRLRGPSGAQFEFTLAAVAQNLRRLAKLVARPPPIVPTGCVAERSVQFVASRLRGKRWSQCVRAAAPPGLAETTASPQPQSIVGTANTSFTPDFCNKIGHKPK